MNIRLSDLPTGKWRYFTPAEIKDMEGLVANSHKTAEPPRWKGDDVQE
jgi:hypothetical protein